ncbi:LuxR family transcriptional regulator [Kineosporia sp. NBRC 101677]|uniref:helix-turn-helix transcriptional regulator n=1 Tax=Kineosporia sp. NBRC 101677 TaxID=3032197 RepID=UPI00249FFECF|nr:LuxR family transcriptional regulator [Kineosporia sp. NBRC 101677]GLY14957.1 LuxR family transcriptional regulator [Kineosporia sp. NBRC 101677]
MKLFGRQAETAALDELLNRAADGAGSALVLWGEPGIGKTALLEYAAEAASGAVVLRCRGTQMEAGLAFAAVHQLLWPVTDQLDLLPAAQAAALRGALGLGRDETELFRVGAAVLSLISRLAQVRPVLVVIDDAQWIDEASAHCLGFVARRVAGEPVALLVTGHQDPAGGPWEGLPAMHVAGLAEDDARELVADVIPGADRELVERTVAAAGGNPLALHELPTIKPESEALTPLGRPADPPLGPRLKRAFTGRAAAMTPPARALLLLAAAEDRGDRDLVHRAGAEWHVGPAAWDEVLRSGLVRASGTRLEFRHPLVRAAVYEATPFLQRQAAHRALAAALPVEAEAERAWHLATAADGPDEDVAKLLEQTAEQCLRLSAGPIAARTLRRAAQLSPQPDAAGRRLAAAARAAWQGGDAELARELLEEAEGLSGEIAVVRTSGGLRGILEFASGRPERAHRYLVGDMSEVAETTRAVQLGTVAVRAAWSAGRPDLQQEALEQVRGLPLDDEPALAALLPVLRNWWACYDPDGRESPVRLDFSGETVTRLSGAAWELLPPVPLVQAWGVEGDLLDVLRVQAEQLRRRHELAGLAMVLSQTAILDTAAGRWDAAQAAASEGLPLAQEVGADHVATQFHGTLAALAAPRGQERAAAEHIDHILRVSLERGVRALSAAAYWHRGRAALFAGRAQDALVDLECLAKPGHEAAHPSTAVTASVDTIEAAVQTGSTHIAEANLVLLAEWAQRSGATWARAGHHRSRAIMDGGPQAEELFRAALEEGLGGSPFEYGRTRLLYGEWLRRARRRADARLELGGAAEIFERLGAQPLRVRALRELDLADGPAARRAPDSAAGLTAQELRVARLAADGLTNREIAAQLPISPRTVGHHLASVYPKLGITSRGELARINFEDGLRLGPAGD